MWCRILETLQGARCSLLYSSRKCLGRLSESFLLFAFPIVNSMCNLISVLNPSFSFNLKPTTFLLTTANPLVSPLSFPPQCILLVQLPCPTTTAEQIRQK